MTDLAHRLAGAAFLAVLAVTAQAEPVTTRIGELSFDVGYPTAETATRLYDEMDFQRATQAYVWALPAVGFHALHLAHLKNFDAPNGAVVLYKDLADKAGMLTPNITTLYAFSFWDLAAQGPLVIEVPAGLTAGGVLDIWQRPMTDMGQTGPDQGQGARYLILPPGAQDMNPEGYIVVQSPTNQVWFGSRGLDPDTAMAEAHPAQASPLRLGRPRRPPGNRLRSGRWPGMDIGASDRSDLLAVPVRPICQ